MPDDASTDAVLLAFARGALIGARGNSGVILSEFLRGFAGAVTVAAEPVGSLRVAARFEAGARGSYAAVAAPVSGTILTAAAGAATEARAAADAGRSLVEVVVAARDGAHAAMLRSPTSSRSCPARGARRGRPGPRPRPRRALPGAGRARARRGPGRRSRRRDVGGGRQHGPHGDRGDRPSDGCSRPAGSGVEQRDVPHTSYPAGGEQVRVGSDGEFEVMFVIESTAATGTSRSGHASPDLGERVRVALQQVGDSVVVVGDGVWQAHVHADDPARAVSAAREAVARRRGCARSACGTSRPRSRRAACTGHPRRAARARPRRGHHHLGPGLVRTSPAAAPWFCS
ncbi:DAK2 domain-containing protein [Oerskovia sp. M15]